MIALTKQHFDTFLSGRAMPIFGKFEFRQASVEPGIAYKKRVVTDLQIYTNTT